MAEVVAPLEIIASGDFKEIDKLFVRQINTGTQADAIKQYDVDKHDVFDTTLRPWRKVKRDSGSKDALGNVIWTDVLIDVVRVGIPWQKMIVERRVGFTLSTPVTLDVIWDKENEKELALVKLVEKILNDNKMDYKNKEILRRKLSELEVAVIWYYVNTPDDPLHKVTLNSKIVSTELGDTLYPLFDSVGTMIAFRRDYQLLEGDKKVDHCDIYTAEYEYKYVKREGAFILDPDVKLRALQTGEVVNTNPVPNVAKKILVEYYNQQKPVWHTVQSLINRHETLASNHGGMNDKFGSPIFVVGGEIKGEIIDNTQGSIMQLENGSTANYAQLASEPQSISLEQENLEKFIYTMSQTPNISFDQMMTIGAMSGFAAEMLLTDPHMAVRMEEESFGLGLQRRLNIIKAAIGALIDTSLANECQTVQIKPVITPYLPQNITELIENLQISYSAGMMSTKTVLEKNPLVDDAETEEKRMQEDSTNQVTGTEDKTKETTTE